MNRRQASNGWECSRVCVVCVCVWVYMHWGREAILGKCNPMNKNMEVREP